MPELQDLLDEWLIAFWQNRPHDGLRDPVHPGRAFTPNEKYAALVETAGYVPVALSADDYIELLPATLAGGQRLRHQDQPPDLRRRGAEPAAACSPRGSGDRKDLWEIHHDPYDVSRIFVRGPARRLDHRVLEAPGPGRRSRSGSWPGTTPAASPSPAPTEEQIADAVAALLQPGHAGPGRRRRRPPARPRNGTGGSPPAPRPARPPRQPARAPHRRAGTGGEHGQDGGSRQDEHRHGDPDGDLRPVRRSGQALVTRAPARSRPAIRR